MDYLRKKRVIRIWILFILLLILTIHHCSRVDAGERKYIRVAVIQSVDHFMISIRGPFKIYNKEKTKLLYEEKRLRPTKVRADNQEITIGRRKFLQPFIRIIPKKDATIYVNERRFRGEIDVVNSKERKLLVTNAVELENYVKGVLYHEVSARWPLEALKAQAIAVRTYALYRRIHNTKRPYDVTNDIYSQVYGGKSSEKYRTNIATNRTRGIILAYKGKLFPAYYHADCGGHTEDVSELWDENLPPLKGVKCPFSKKSPHYTWKRNFQSKDVQKKLNAKGYDIWLIKNIKVMERNKSGRIRLLRITDRKGKAIQLKGKDFRQIIGPNKIKSNNYRIVMKGYYFDLIGKGWGHGVGLCQWGSNFMARRRYSYDKILQYYYPGVTITRYETLGL